MRVLFTSYAEKTHFLGMVPLAWAMRCAGHEVRVASQPELTDVITRAGLTAAPVGKNHVLHQFMKHAAAGPGDDATGQGDADGDEHKPFDFEDVRPEGLTWEALTWAYRQIVPWWYGVVNNPMVDDLVSLARQWRPDLVVWEPATYAGPIAAKVVGAAHARMMWSVDLFGLMRHHFLRQQALQPETEREDLLARWIGGRAARHGAAFSEDMTTGHFTIDNVPGSLRHDPALGLDLGLDYLPMRYMPYNGVAVVPPWLREPPARRRVAVTLGVSSTERLSGYAVPVQDILDALADLDAEIVATLPAAQQQQLRQVPDNTRVVEFAPLNALAQTCAAVIHHGGNGSYCTTLTNGVPQLIVPFFFDGALRAQYLTRQGAGLTIPRAQVTPAKIRSNLVRLLEEPSFHHNAIRLRDEMHALPTPNHLVPEIERLVTKHRTDATTES